jgi:peptidoglycan/LPS O-acetylase OafA/YrhL
MKPANASTSYIPTLDGMRSVAILMVMVSHGIDRERFPDIAHLGYAGVLIFFAISGYLITTRLVDEYKAMGRISLRDFYIRRAFRILPPATLFLVVLWVLSLTGLVVCSVPVIRSALFFYTNYLVVGPMGWRAGHFWSLSVEEHFYLLWPCLLIFFGARTGWRTALALIAMLCAWRILDTHHHILPILNSGRTDLIADALLWGCVLAFFKFNLSRWLSTLVAVGSAALLAGYAMGVRLPFPPHNTDYTVPIMMLLPAVLLGAIVSCPSAPIGRFLELAPIRYIGRLSYSLYIWQQLFLGGPGPRLPLVFAIAAAFACAYLSYRFVEKPCIRFGKRFTARQALVAGSPIAEAS